METYLKITCMFELAEKNFKAAITNMLNVIKENMFPTNEQTGNLTWKSYKSMRQALPEVQCKGQPKDENGAEVDKNPLEY